MMCNLEVVNNTPQDVSFPVLLDGSRVWRSVGPRGKLYMVGAEPTPELLSLDRSKHLNFHFRVVQE